MEQLKIQEKKGANYNLLELFGVLDSYNFTELQQKAFVLIKENNWVLDLSNFRFQHLGIGVWKDAVYYESFQ